MADPGLRHRTLQEWRQWSKRRNRLQRAVRSAKQRVHPPAISVPSLYLPHGPVRTLVVIDLLTPSCRFAIHSPLQYLDPRTTAVLTTVEDPGLASEGTWTRMEHTAVAQFGDNVDNVLSLGSYLGLSGPVREWARRNDIRFNVVQHGLLTPWSPPAADGDHLLAWTEQDADYWRAGNTSVTADIVGSQMLWSAAQLPPVALVDERPVLLGQLHGIEMNKRGTLNTYLRFCRANHASYRPHPNESDAISRAAHALMRRTGVDVETSGRDLIELGRPVVSIFSTGSLEAAHRGLPAWVTHPDPPAWLRDFWRRYQLARWGSPATASWHRPSREPAAEVARALDD